MMCIVTLNGLLLDKYKFLKMNQLLNLALAYFLLFFSFISNSCAKDIEIQEYQEYGEATMYLTTMDQQQLLAPKVL